MIILVLAIFGLCLGSFVNAWVWRLHEQEKPKKHTAKQLKQLSISRGRSMCPECKHELRALDLIPVLSWLLLGGKCRYCHKQISAQYPIVELSTAFLFVGSYIWWPASFSSSQIAIFLLWLVLIVGFMALIVYDLRWYLLPNRIIYPLTGIATVQAFVRIFSSQEPLSALISTLLSVAIGGGVFYLLYQFSAGKWIGGGDVRLGWLLGLVVGSAAGSVLVIFVASLLGTLVSLPLLLTGRFKRTSVIPFGPFLIIGAFIVVLFGSNIIDWYQRTFLNF